MSIPTRRLWARRFSRVGYRLAPFFTKKALFITIGILVGIQVTIMAVAAGSTAVRHINWLNAPASESYIAELIADGTTPADIIVCRKEYIARVLRQNTLLYHGPATNRQIRESVNACEGAQLSRAQNRLVKQ